jgi:hypothetical protein
MMRLKIKDIVSQCSKLVFQDVSGKTNGNGGSSYAVYPFLKPIYATGTSRIHRCTDNHYRTFGGQLLKWRVGIFLIPRGPLPE